MADRVGLDDSTFTIKVNGENIKKKSQFQTLKLWSRFYLKSSKNIT